MLHTQDSRPHSHKEQRVWEGVNHKNDIASFPRVSRPGDGYPAPRPASRRRACGGGAGGHRRLGTCLPASRPGGNPRAMRGGRWAPRPVWASHRQPRASRQLQRARPQCRRASLQDLGPWHNAAERRTRPSGCGDKCGGRPCNPAGRVGSTAGRLHNCTGRLNCRGLRAACPPGAAPTLRAVGRSRWRDGCGSRGGCRLSRRPCLTRCHGPNGRVPRSPRA